MQNNELIRFAAKALGIFVAWYLVYDLWILPDGRVDHALSLHIISVAGGIMEAFGFEPWYAGRVMGLPGANGIEMVDGCNGLEALGLFVGFVLAYPGPAKARLWFIPLGLFLIYAVNILRLIVLAWTQLSAPGLFDFTHDYSTTAIFYIVIFAMWVWWANLGDSPRAEA